MSYLHKWLIMFIVLILANQTMLFAYDYPCPYSGPADDQELDYSAVHYKLETTIHFPEGENDGFIDGKVMIQGKSLKDNLNLINIDFLQDEFTTLKSVLWESLEGNFLFEDNEIQVIPPDALSENETFEITVEFRVTGEQHFRYRPRGEPRYAFNSMVENSRWFPCLHDPRDKATYEIVVTVDQDKIAASNGVLSSVTDNQDGTVTFYWRENKPMASYLVTINVADYATFTHDYHGMNIDYYVVPEHLTAAQSDFENDINILDFYSAAFGEYPFEKLGLAEVTLGGAMENQDMISYGKVLITGDKSYEDTFAHEISHMWWGDSVTLTNCKDVWLNEGFASYCEALWEEHFYGADAYDNVLAEFKDRYFQEDSQNRFAIYDPDILWSSTTYKKAAWVLHMLRWVVGDDAFWVILSDYYEKYKYKNATTADFQAICELHYGNDLSWFFHEWIMEPGFPEYQVAYKVDEGKNKLLLQIYQRQQNAPECYEMPIEVSWSYASGDTESTVIWNDKKDQFVEIDLQEMPLSVEFDPQGKILSTIEWIDWKETQVEIWMPQSIYSPGDSFECKVYIDYYDGEVLQDYPLFVILEILNVYYFAPSFSDFDSYIDEYSSFPFGRTEIQVIESFQWPQNVGTFNDAIWYAALTDPQVTSILGNYHSFSFGWKE